MKVWCSKSNDGYDHVAESILHPLTTTFAAIADHYRFLVATDHLVLDGLCSASARPQIVSDGRFRRSNVA